MYYREDQAINLCEASRDEASSDRLTAAWCQVI
jgi:hypothetical protein